MLKEYRVIRRNIVREETFVLASNWEEAEEKAIEKDEWGDTTFETNEEE
jgi:hypothetical protein